MAATRGARAKKLVGKIIKVGSELFGKIICVFDDLPFLLVQYAGEAGSYLLAGAGLLIFPVEAWEGINGIKKARKFKGDPKLRNNKMGTSVAKIAFSGVGFAASAALIAFIVADLAFLGAGAMVAVPAMMAAITATELVKNAYHLYHLKNNPPVLPADSTKEEIEAANVEYAKAIENGKRKVTYNSLYLGFATAITVLATISILTGLGVASFGIVPAAVLVGVVCVALAVKIFELVDKKKGHAMTNAIKNFFGKISSRFKNEPQETYYTRVEMGQQSTTMISQGLGAAPSMQPVPANRKRKYEVVVEAPVAQNANDLEQQWESNQSIMCRV